MLMLKKLRKQFVRRYIHKQVKNSENQEEAIVLNLDEYLESGKNRNQISGSFTRTRWCTSNHITSLQIHDDTTEKVS